MARRSGLVALDLDDIDFSGVRFRVREAVVLAAQSGGESPWLVVDRIQHGQCAQEFMSVGILANLTRGATHNPGTGARIDWAQAPRRPLTAGHSLVAQRAPTELRVQSQFARA